MGGLATDARLPAGQRLRIGLAAAYLASPLDIIPDWIPVLGQMDDLVVAAVLLDSLFQNVSEEILLSHWNGPQGQLQAMKKTAQFVSCFVPGIVRRRIAV